MKGPDGEELTNNPQEVPRRVCQCIIAEEPYQGQAPTGWLRIPLWLRIYKQSGRPVPKIVCRKKQQIADVIFQAQIF